MQTTMRKPSLLMRACPRCRGDLYRDMLENNLEFVCLQCGRRADTSSLSLSDQPPAGPPLRRTA